MITPSRYTVPLDALDRVQVDVEDQVEAHAAGLQATDAARWGGSLQPAYGDGAGGGGAEGACDGGGE